MGKGLDRENQFFKSDYSITQGEELINSGKFSEAHLLLKKYEKEGKIDTTEKLLCHLLQSLVSRYLGNYHESYKFGEKAYQESKKMEKHLLTIDALTNMIYALIWLGDFEKAEVLILEGEKLLQVLNHEPLIEFEKRKASLFDVKASFLLFKGDMEKALEYRKISLETREKYGTKREIVETLNGLGWIYSFTKSDLDIAVKHVERCLVLAKEINHQQFIHFSYANLGVIYALKGDLDLALNYHNQALSYFEVTNNIQWITGTLSNIAEIYKHQGKFDLALKYREKSLKLAQKMENVWFIGTSLSNIIDDFIQIGDIQNANLYLEELEQFNYKEKNNWIEVGYLVSKAIILKSSPRFQSRAEAEQILREVIQREVLSNPDYIIDAIINLCELLLDELRITNDITILKDLHPYLKRLLDIAKDTNSYWFLVEALILQAKLALVTLDLTDARRLLTQAQQIAETHGMHRLATKVSFEHDELLQKLDLWEMLKDSKSSLSDRLKLSNLDKQIKVMIQKRRSEIPEVIDEIPIMILVISEGGIPTFSKSFAETFIVEDDLLSSFLAAFNTFSGELFSEGLDRASFGEYTLIIKPISTFLVCYFFKGPTYSALKRIEKFIEGLNKNKDVLDKFREYQITNRMIKNENLPNLESLIKEIFLN